MDISKINNSLDASFILNSNKYELSTEDVTRLVGLIDDNLRARSVLRIECDYESRKVREFMEYLIRLTNQYELKK